jgi:hypothetical protein
VSRRHHGGRPHRPAGNPRPFEPHHAQAVVQPRAAEATVAPGADAGVEPVAFEVAPAPAPLNGPSPNGSLNGHMPETNGLHPGAEVNGSREPSAPAGCTAPQLRRFIKSRPYVPMHELRRRFGIDGGDDDVTVVVLGAERIYVGLPHREGTLLGELLRGGDIGYELSLDPRSPVVIGLYPMRPIARA